MAPTCNWVIKIVKVNKLYLNYLLVSIVNRVSRSGTMKYPCEWKHRSVQQEMLTYLRSEGKAAFLVQRGRSAIFRRWESCRPTSSADKTHLVSSGGRPETGAIPVFLRATLKAGTAEWRKMTPNPKTRNGGKWPQILKHGTAENDPKS